MKTGLKMMAVVCMLIITACDQSPYELAKKDPKNPVNQKPSAPAINTKTSYQFNTTTCDTHPRYFASTKEMCLALQIDLINNSCAEDQRRSFHKKMCSESLWMGSSHAELRMKNTNGAYIECWYNEVGASTRYQLTYERRMEMKHNSSMAKVSYSYKKGTFKINMQLYDLDTKKLITKDAGTWIDEAPESLTIANTSHPGSPSLTCKIDLGQIDY